MSNGHGDATLVTRTETVIEGLPAIGGWLDHDSPGPVIHFHRMFSELPREGLAGRRMELRAGGRTWVYVITDYDPATGEFTAQWPD